MFLAAVMMVFADDATPTDTASPETAERSSSLKGGGSNSGNNSNNGNNGKKNNEEDVGKIFKTMRIGEWRLKPYVRPGGGVQIGSGKDGAVASVVAGADVGLRHWKKPWAGDAFVGASYTAGSSLNGLEIHLGESFGARQNMWGISLGLTGFYDMYTSSAGQAKMESTGGVDIPLNVVIGPRTFYGYIGLTPTFVTNPDRQIKEGSIVGTIKSCERGVGAACGANAGMDFYIGHEFSWGLGLGLKTKTVVGALGIQHDINVAGSFWTPVVSLAWAG